MARFFTVFGFVALMGYAYAQYTSWSLFDNTASGSSRSPGSTGRSYHK